MPSATGSEPGRVDVVVIPDIRNRLPFDPFEPKAPADLLLSIEEYLAARSPAVATVVVKNAHYVVVKIRLAVRFRARGNEDFDRKRLEEELQRFLSPWAYDGVADLVIGGRIYANSIIDFLDRRPYIDYLANLRLFTSDDGENFRPVLLPLQPEEAYAVTAERPDAVLVAARRHEIDLIPEAGFQVEQFEGIGFMRVELDFIVA